MSDLGLDFVRTRGRAPANLTAELVREIDTSDLEALANVEKGSKTPALKRLSERHHALARALASGESPAVAALMCGYELSRVSILQADPAFQELMCFYREEKDRAFRSVQDKLAGIASDALDELQTRLEDEPEKLTTGQLMQIVSMGADRTGNGPSSTQNLNVNEGTAQRLAAAQARLKERRQEKTIDG